MIAATLQPPFFGGQQYGRPMEKCEPPANQRHIIRLDLYLAHQYLGSQIWFATLVG